MQRNCQYFFKKFKTVHALRVNETKLTSANAFIVDVFALGGDRKSQ